MPILRPAPADIPAELRVVVDYRKSGLSLNHVVGCPLDCGYCVRHLFHNFGMKQPRLVMDDVEAVDRLVGHWAFRPGTTPLQIFNRATDPFLPGVKEHLFATLEELDRRRLTNPTLVITRWKIEPDDVARLDKLKSLRLTVLVTWSGIEDDRIEPVASSIAENSMQVLKAAAVRTKSILYWRPVIAGLNDTAHHLERARELSFLTDAMVFTGLFHRQKIRAYFRDVGVGDLYPSIARRKILPAETEQRIIAALAGRPLFRKTSCGVAYAHRTTDYNGHFGIREICDICPVEQVERCASSHRKPDLTAISKLAELAELDVTSIDVNDRRIEVEGSTEQQRYFMQHSLNFQVHDQGSPHFYGRHGRAEVGWD
ncbi:radical SAM protein [Bradyrhizobium sp. USDA 4520]